jgi:hypothetical protein
MASYSPITIARFWSKVDVRVSKAECWVWKASKSKSGYGKLKVGGRNLIASRVAWEIVNNSSLGSDVFARHKCDNPSCCNPTHIEPGTHRDNMQDMKQRGRHRPAPQIGEQNPRAKLTERDVSTIRSRIALGENNTQIASDFPVGHAMISNIRRGKAWGFVG